jgi:hypothetical protein
MSVVITSNHTEAPYWLSVLSDKGRIVLSFWFTLCDFFFFKFQVLDRQGRFQHDITVHESTEGCITTCGPGLDKWDTYSFRDTTSSKYTYGACSSIWPPLCLRKFIQNLYIKRRDCTNKLQNITVIICGTDGVMTHVPPHPPTWSHSCCCLMNCCFQILLLTAH